MVGRMLVGHGMVVLAAAWMLAAGMQREVRALLPSGSELGALEAQAARESQGGSALRLARAYLDLDQPGLAAAALEARSAELGEEPEAAHLRARTLFRRGQPREALAAAREARATCAAAAGCPLWIEAAAMRQVAFFEQVVAAGIDDPDVDPAATRAAYDRSVREVHLVAMR